MSDRTPIGWILVCFWSMLLLVMMHGCRLDTAERRLDALEKAQKPISP